MFTPPSFTVRYFSSRAASTSLRNEASESGKDSTETPSSTAKLANSSASMLLPYQVIISIYNPRNAYLSCRSVLSLSDIAPGVPTGCFPRFLKYMLCFSTVSTCSRASSRNLCVVSVSSVANPLFALETYHSDTRWIRSRLQSSRRALLTNSAFGWARRSLRGISTTQQVHLQRNEQVLV